MAPVAALAALICVGIGVDFSGQALMEQALRDDAAHCARQVSTQMAAPTTPGHESAAAAVRQCLSQLGLTGKIEVDGATLTVTVDGRYATRLLSVVAIDNLPVHGVVTVTTRARR
jgi:hypothetical protein